MSTRPSIPVPSWVINAERERCQPRDGKRGPGNIVWLVKAIADFCDVPPTDYPNPSLFPCWGSAAKIAERANKSSKQVQRLLSLGPEPFRIGNESGLAVQCGYVVPLLILPHWRNPSWRYIVWGIPGTKGQLDRCRAKFGQNTWAVARQRLERRAWTPDDTNRLRERDRAYALAASRNAPEPEPGDGLFVPRPNESDPQKGHCTRESDPQKGGQPHHQNLDLPRENQTVSESHDPLFDRANDRADLAADAGRGEGLDAVECDDEDRPTGYLRDNASNHEIERAMIECGLLPHRARKFCGHPLCSAGIINEALSRLDDRHEPPDKPAAWLDTTIEDLLDHAEDAEQQRHADAQSRQREAIDHIFADIAAGEIADDEISAAMPDIDPSELRSDYALSLEAARRIHARRRRTETTETADQSPALEHECAEGRPG